VINNILKSAYAHCDIPCGIYETDTMKHSAATAKKMVEKINDLGDLTDKNNLANFIRMIETKEIHAKKVKDELSILWSDYFKPEHLEKFPNLHNDIWLTMKQASRVKQYVSEEDCSKLIQMVNGIDVIFQKTKS
jgi:nickel superoxide dismutase